MNRRDFLTALIAVPIAASLPIAPAAPPFSSVKLIRSFTVDADGFTRWDVLYGFSTLNPDFAVRIASA